MNYMPIRGSTWLHKNGNKYVVLYITNTANDDVKHPPDVVYATSVEDGEPGPVSWGSDVPPYNHERIWSRPLADWHRSFTRVDR